MWSSTLPMLTASDLRLLDADGTVVQVGVLGAAAGWGTLPAEVQPFAAPLHEWTLPPLPAIVLRRSALLDAFFDTPGLRLPDRHCGWLLAQSLYGPPGGEMGYRDADPHLGEAGVQPRGDVVGAIGHARPGVGADDGLEDLRRRAGDVVAAEVHGPQSASLPPSPSRRS